MAGHRIWSTTKGSCYWMRDKAVAWSTAPFKAVADLFAWWLLVDQQIWDLDKDLSSASSVSLLRLSPPQDSSGVPKGFGGSGCCLCQGGWGWKGLRMAQEGTCSPGHWGREAPFHTPYKRAHLNRGWNVYSEIQNIVNKSNRYSALHQALWWVSFKWWQARSSGVPIGDSVFLLFSY